MGDIDTASERDMRPSKLPLTLIVAATSKGGIGKNGTLPWSLKAEMKYFARVTTRLPDSLSPSTGETKTAKNAVIMGRKTWESIPPKFRPLKGRVNVVISRSGKVKGLDASTAHQRVEDEDVVMSESLEQGLESLADVQGPRLGRAFVIGGSSIYAEALKLEQTKHVLMTKVLKDFECDTFFPIDLDGDDGKKEGWRQDGLQDLAAFTGEDFGDDGSSARQQEGDVPFEYCLYTRK